MQEYAPFQLAEQHEQTEGPQEGGDEQAQRHPLEAVGIFGRGGENASRDRQPDEKQGEGPGGDHVAFMRLRPCRVFRDETAKPTKVIVGNIGGSNVHRNPLALRM